jgi:hypothetical protein
MVSAAYAPAVEAMNAKVVEAISVRNPERSCAVGLVIILLPFGFVADSWISPAAAGVRNGYFSLPVLWSMANAFVNTP